MTDTEHNDTLHEALTRWGEGPGRWDDLRELLASGADVNAAPAPYCNTPLHVMGFMWNASPQDCEGVHLLLDAGADVYATNCYGEKAIDSLLWKVSGRIELDDFLPVDDPDRCANPAPVRALADRLENIDREIEARARSKHLDTKLPQVEAENRDLKAENETLKSQRDRLAGSLRSVLAIEPAQAVAPTKLRF